MIDRLQRTQLKKVGVGKVNQVQKIDTSAPWLMSEISKITTPWINDQKKIFLYYAYPLYLLL